MVWKADRVKKGSLPPETGFRESTFGRCFLDPLCHLKEDSHSNYIEIFIFSDFLGGDSISIIGSLTSSLCLQLGDGAGESGFKPKLESPFTSQITGFQLA